MRPYRETKVRWEATLNGNDNITDLRAAVKENSGRNPCAIGLRSICWKVFLLFGNLDTSTWMKTLLDSRSAYASLKEHFMRNIENPDDLSAEDPLTDTETSPWNVLRQDEELRAEILQDVERCMPENSYFREPYTQTILLDILFIYCKLNKDVGYRQGMHEVLAPILWVVTCDAIESKSVGENYDDRDKIMLTSLDQQHVEHDAFTLFGIIMQTVKTFYEMGSSGEPATSGLLNNSPIVERSKRIHEYYLHNTDPELAEHLSAIEILPQIFLIRWVRLLFGREFPFEDVLAVWDFLFAEDPGLDLIDLISVSMLLRIRWQLLEADYTGALTLLLRYPAPVSPHGPSTFVGDALYLRDNLMLDGGDHIISKYSRRAPETTVTRKVPKKVKRARTAEQLAAQKAAAPSMSPGRFIQEQVGLEGIIQEAAKGVYNQGEKWGVTKALRGAVQGLQSGTTSPRRPLDRPTRWSLDTGKQVSDSRGDLITKIEGLEQRNKSLAKLLENAMAELWAKEKEIHQGKDDAAAATDTLSLAIAKVQIVQVYLENSTMPLPSDSLSPGEVKDEILPTGPAKAVRPSSPMRSSPSLDGMTDSSSSRTPNPAHTHLSPSRTPVSIPPNPSTPISKPTLPPTSPGLSPFHQSRPALAQSSFSWMLGEDQQKSDFVSTSPFPSASRRDHNRTGPLFGKEGGEGKGKGVRGSREDGNGVDGAGGKEDDDVFTMGDMKKRTEGT